MRKIIHHLRRQPEDVRRHILHLLTIAAGVVLLILWIWSLGRSVSNPDTAATAEENLEPFSTLKDNIIDGYKSISQ